MAGGGSSRFFESLRLFKNVESRWDISGFTKKPHVQPTDVQAKSKSKRKQAG
jgi:hypothetical protein